VGCRDVLQPPTGVNPATHGPAAAWKAHSRLGIKWEII